MYKTIYYFINILFLRKNIASAGLKLTQFLPKKRHQQNLYLKNQLKPYLVQQIVYDVESYVKKINKPNLSWLGFLLPLFLFFSSSLTRLECRILCFWPTLTLTLTSLISWTLPKGERNYGRCRRSKMNYISIKWYLFRRMNIKIFSQIAIILVIVNIWRLIKNLRFYNVMFYVVNLQAFCLCKPLIEN